MEDNRRFWERMAKLYGPIQERSNAALYRAVSAHSEPYLTDRTRVLEIACGSGQLTLPLCGKAASWEATDFSEKMVKETARRCPSVTTAVRDVTDLPYKDGSFDLVLMANALHILPEPETGLAEIRRVLTADGVVLLPTFIYEHPVKGFNRFRMRVTEMLGFRSYHKWTLRELTTFTERAGFRVIEAAILPGNPLPEGFIAARKD